jgi:decaprenylphospho-beta-D-ribofuranose 2-oxidase
MVLADRPSDVAAGVPMLLQGWGRLRPTAAMVSRPERPADVAELLMSAGRRGTLARGLGRSYGDEAQNAGGRVLDMTRLRRVLEFDRGKGLIHVEAGLDLASLLRYVVPEGWFLPVSPGTRFVTIGGAIANDVHGKNHHVDGGFARHVRSISLLTPAYGIQRVGPDRQPEIFWATAGGLGLTGIILDATLQLLPIQTSWMHVGTEQAWDLDDLLERLANRAAAHRYAVAWIDCLAHGRRLGRGIVDSAEHATPDDLRGPAGTALTFRPRTYLTVPFTSPVCMAQTPTCRAFNAGRLLLSWARPQLTLTQAARFFFPLDAIGGWNRLYGRQGFIQYQLAVPSSATGVLEAIVETIATQRRATALAVVKRLGEGGPMLSFPIPGWTLSIDLPAAQPGLGRLLDEFDAMVAAAGGRVYLGKDARVRRAAFEAMYPELPEWLELRQQLDPAQVLRSDMARRLGLVG